MLLAPPVVIDTERICRQDGSPLAASASTFHIARVFAPGAAKCPPLASWIRPNPLAGRVGRRCFLVWNRLKALAAMANLPARPFAWNEDTDLCWPSCRFGFWIFHNPAAVGVHGRGWREAERRPILLATRGHPLMNHCLQLVKNEKLGGVSLIRRVFPLGGPATRVRRCEAPFDVRSPYENVARNSRCTAEAEARGESVC